MSGNGIDLGAIHQILVDVAQVQQEHGRQLVDLRVQVVDLRAQVGDVRKELRTEVGGLRTDISDLRYQIGGLRQQLTEYHSSVLGHGILISELDLRVRRLEEHLGLPPAV